MKENDIHPFACVNVAVLREDGAVLLTRRSAKIREPGLWCLPGGHLECDEAWEEAARRELQEETGLIAARLELFGLYSDPALTIAATSKAGTERAHFFCAAFRAIAWTGDLRLNDEVDAFQWVHPQMAPTPMVRSHPIRLADAVAFRGEIFLR